MPGRRTALQVLLVEDDQIDVENVRRAFAKSGAAVQLTVASDGERALELLRGGLFPLDNCVILLDLNMPRMNGIEFLRALRRDPAYDQVPIVVLTTSDAEPDRVGAHDLDVSGYMLKPITFDDFVTTLAAAETYWGLQELS
jgi:CheY-like chemotaxis protein